MSLALFHREVLKLAEWMRGGPERLPTTSADQQSSLQWHCGLVQGGCHLQRRIQFSGAGVLETNLPILAGGQQRDLYQKMTFIQQAFIKCPLHVRLNSRVLRTYSNDYTRQICSLQTFQKFQPDNGENLEQEKENNLLPLILLDFQFTWQNNDLNNIHFFPSISQDMIRLSSCLHVWLYSSFQGLCCISNLLKVQIIKIQQNAHS